MLPEKGVNVSQIARRRYQKMKRNCNENSTAMEVPLPTCFATLREGVDSNNANGSYNKIGVVLGRRKNRTPDCIQNFEHHIPLFSKASEHLICDGTLQGRLQGYVIRVQSHRCARIMCAIFLFFPMLPKGGTYHPRYAVYLHVNPHPSFLLVGEFWVHPPAGS
jgi:hypothetical protein